MPTGFELFQQAEMEYQLRGNAHAAMDLYVSSIKQIVQRENPVTRFPTSMLTQMAAQANDFPEQILGTVWRNFVGFFRDPNMGFTKENKPEAWKLLEAFRPGKVEVDGVAGITGRFERFGRTDEGKALLKGMQVTAGLTLGLLAWDRKDRATAAKRYKEALDLAATYAPFNDKACARTPLDRYVSSDVQDTKDNLAILVKNDEVNAELVKELAGAFGVAEVLGMDGVGGAPGRKTSYPVPNVRLEKDGSMVQEDVFTFATDACNSCGKRGVKLERCSRCRKAWYCSKECQTKDWKIGHKANCNRAT